MSKYTRTHKYTLFSRCGGIHTSRASASIILIKPLRSFFPSSPDPHSPSGSQHGHLLHTSTLFSVTVCELTSALRPLNIPTAVKMLPPCLCVYLSVHISVHAVAKRLMMSRCRPCRSSAVVRETSRCYRRPWMRAGERASQGQRR